MSDLRAGLLWHYHLGRLLRSAGTWVTITIFAVLAGTQGLLTERTPDIINVLAGAEMKEIFASTMPVPSWQESYSGWMKSLAQVLGIVLITINGLACASLVRNGDIPFILTKNVRRSHYLLTFAVTSWCFIAILGLIAATVTWAGTTIFFPRAPFLPVVVATMVWVLQIIVIHMLQLFLATIKPGAGLPLAGGFTLYLLSGLASLAERIAVYSPLGLSTLSTSIATQAPRPEWTWPVMTSLVALIALGAMAIWRFNRTELS